MVPAPLWLSPLAPRPVAAADCAWRRQGWSPADATWGPAPRGRISAGLAEWLIDREASTSFADAQREPGKLTGLAVSAESIRQYTERRGAELETADPAAAQIVDATREAADPVEPAPGEVVVETDGVGVRDRDGWHEVKLGLVGGQLDGGLQALSYVGARATPEDFGPRLLAEAVRRARGRGLGGAGRKPGDPAPGGRARGWGARDLEAEPVGERVEVVDFSHAAEHVWAIAHALCGEGTTFAALAREHAGRPAC